jgi:hypothetical protein
MWREEIGMSYNYLYMPSLEYGTPVTTLTKKDCEEIQRQVVNTILPKMGIVQTAPRSVVFGTAQFGGLWRNTPCGTTASYSYTVPIGTSTLRRRYRATHANST